MQSKNDLATPLESQESLIAHAADEYFAATARGERPSISEYVERYPAIADEIRNIFPALAFLDHSATSPANGRFNTSSELPKTLGDYRLIREIGRGGMGIVFEAEQQSIDRRVALKILPFASVAAENSLKRFKNEVRTAASLEHPHIVSIFASGEDRGVHYFAMQLIRGQSLAEIISDLQAGRRSKNTFENDSSPPRTQSSVETFPIAELLTVREGNKSDYFRRVADLGIQACDALHYAHQMGVIHRDVKPSNLILGDSGRVWLADFGLAAGNADVGITMTGDLVGTLRYMSPEQASGSTIIDHRTDIYSIGATLYELMTLQAAVNTNDRRDIVRTIVDGQPTHPRLIDVSIPVDLETIVLKCLEKEPSERYFTAEDLASDLKRYASGHSILARPPSTIQHFNRWARRHAGAISFALAASLLGLALMAGALTLLAEARTETIELREVAVEERRKAFDQRDVAVAERDQSLLHQYQAEIVAGQIDAQQENFSGLRDTLGRHLPLSGEGDRRGWEWYYLMSLCHTEVRTARNEGFQAFTAWSPDGDLLGSAGVIRRSDTGERIRTFDSSPFMRMRGAWSPDGQQFGWGIASDGNVIYVWDRTSDELHSLQGHLGGVWCLDWSSDGAQIASGSIDRTVRIWDAATRKQVREIPMSHNVMGVAWSPDGKLLASAVHWTGIVVMRPETGEIVYEIPQEGGHHCVAWHPSGQRLAAAGQDRWRLLDAANGRELANHPLKRGGRAIEYSPDGTSIAVTDGESVGIWNVETDKLQANLAGHLRSVISVSWSPDGKELVTSSEDNEIKVWKLESVMRSSHASLDSSIESLEWSEDGETIVAIDEKAGTQLTWDPCHGSIERLQVKNHDNAQCVSRDRCFAAAYSEDEHQVLVTDLATGETRSTLRLRKGDKFRNCEFNDDGKKLAVATSEGVHASYANWDIENERLISVWRREVAAESLTGPVRLVWDHTGTYIATVDIGDLGDDGRVLWNDYIHVIDAATGQRVLKHTPPGAGATRVTYLAWGPLRGDLAIGTFDGRAGVINVESRKAAFTAKLHRNSVQTLAWHPLGRRVASGSIDGQVKLIDANNGARLLSFDMPMGGIHRLTWSTDGKKLVAATRDGELRIWDSSGGYEFSDDGARRGELAWVYDSREAWPELLECAPDNSEYWQLRGKAYARLCKFTQASQEFSKAISQIRVSLNASINRAHCHLAAGDITRYRQECRSLLADFGKGPDRHVVASACVLSPLSGVEMSEFLGNGQDHATWYADNPQLLGAILVRDRQYHRAVEVLTNVHDSHAGGGDHVDLYDLTYTRYFLALARAGLKEHVQARRLFELAAKEAELAKQGPWSLRRVITLDALEHEVRQSLR